MNNIIIESVLAEIRIPSNYYMDIVKIAEDKELSINAVILHFLSMGLMTYKTLVEPIEQQVKEFVENEKTGI